MPASRSMPTENAGEALQGYCTARITAAGKIDVRKKIYGKQVRRNN
jgi:hypothetical protein